MMQEQDQAAPEAGDRISLSPAEIEGHARALVRAREAGLLSPEAFRKMETRFKAQDTEGVIWTFGLESGEWHRQEGSQWLQAQPPAALEIDAGLIQTVQSISQQGAGSPPAPDQVEAAAIATTVEPPEEAGEIGIDEAPTDPEMLPPTSADAAGAPASEAVDSSPVRVEPAAEPDRFDQDVDETPVPMPLEEPPEPTPDLPTGVEATAPQDEAATMLQTPAEEEAVWVLTVMEGPGTGQSYPLGEQTSIGRADDSAMMIDDKKISRQHALIQKIAGEYYVSDQNSVNGTLVNGERVVDPVLLQPGDKLQLGDSVLRVHAEGDRPDEPAAADTEPEAEAERRIPWLPIGAGVLVFICALSVCCGLVYYFIQTQ